MDLDTLASNQVLEHPTRFIDHHPANGIDKSLRQTHLPLIDHTHTNVHGTPITQYPIGKMDGNRTKSGEIC